MDPFEIPCLNCPIQVENKTTQKLKSLISKFTKPINKAFFKNFFFFLNILGQVSGTGLTLQKRQI